MTALSKPQVGGPIIAVALIAAFIIAYGALAGKEKMPGRPAVTRYWYFDVDTKRLFSATNKGMPPIDAPSGPGKGVRAHVYACGHCGDEDTLFIAYIVKYTDTARSGGGDPGKVIAGNLIADPKAMAWHPRESAAGAIISDVVARHKCPKGTPRIKCYPGRD